MTELVCDVSSTSWYKQEESNTLDAAQYLALFIISLSLTYLLTYLYIW